MNCQRFQEEIADLLGGRVDAGARQQLMAHLDECSACRAELADTGVVWRGLGALPVAEPDRAMRSRFVEVLEAYQAGMKQAAPPNRWIAGWWPSRAVWQTAMATGLLLAGGMGERFLIREHAVAPEIAQLQGQVESLRQTVALSMLQDQSPSSRIRGVSYGSQISRPSGQIEQALLYAVNHDANVNVRLSAVDALEKLAGDAQVRRALVDALPMQDSPLVEIALIDVLVQARERNAVEALRRLAQDTGTEDSVRQRAAAGVEQLEKSK